jgi:hypothetical protein
VIRAADLPTLHGDISETGGATKIPHASLVCAAN